MRHTELSLLGSKIYQILIDNFLPLQYIPPTSLE
jgi:hypothetical protein